MAQLTVTLVCLLLASFACCSYGSAVALIGPRSDTTLANFLLSRQAQPQSADAAASAQCFGLFVPLLQQAANQWSVDYNNCLSVADGNRTALLQQAQQVQAAISADAGDVCKVIDTCQSINGTLDGLNCFAQLGQNVLSTVYDISNNASDAAAALLQQLEVISVQLQRCSNASERAYVEQTASLYDALDYCLQHGPPPTVAPITDPVPTTLTTPTPTDAPAEVMAPSDEAPEAADYAPVANYRSLLPADSAPAADYRAQLLELLQQRRASRY